MGKGLCGQVLGHPAPTSRRINRFQAFRERPDRPGPAQGQRLGSLQQRFDGPPQLRPILDLTGNRTLGDRRRQPCIEHEFFGELYGLAHSPMVAKRYQSFNKALRPAFPGIGPQPPRAERGLRLHS